MLFFLFYAYFCLQLLFRKVLRWDGRGQKRASNRIMKAFCPSAPWHLMHISNPAEKHSGCLLSLRRVALVTQKMVFALGCLLHLAADPPGGNEGKGKLNGGCLAP